MRTPILPPRCFLYGRNSQVEVFLVKLFGGRRTFLFYGNPLQLVVPDHVFVVNRDRTTNLCELYAYATGGTDTDLRVSPLPNVYPEWGRACTPQHKSPTKMIDGFLSGDFNLEVNKLDVWGALGLSGIESWAEKSRPTYTGIPIDWRLLPKATPVWPEGVRWVRCPVHYNPSLVWVNTTGRVNIVVDARDTAVLDTYMNDGWSSLIYLNLTRGRFGWAALAKADGVSRQRTLWEWAKRAMARRCP